MEWLKLNNLASNCVKCSLLNHFQRQGHFIASVHLIGRRNVLQTIGLVTFEFSWLFLKPQEFFWFYINNNLWMEFHLQDGRKRQPLLSSVTRLGYFLKFLKTTFLTKVAQIVGNFLGYFDILQPASTFWATFGNILDTFYSNIWSHWPSGPVHTLANFPLIVLTSWLVWCKIYPLEQDSI